MWKIYLHVSSSLSTAQNNSPPLSPVPDPSRSRTIFLELNCLNSPGHLRLHYASFNVSFRSLLYWKLYGKLYHVRILLISNLKCLPLLPFKEKVKKFSVTFIRWMIRGISHIGPTEIYANVIVGGDVGMNIKTALDNQVQVLSYISWSISCIFILPTNLYLILTSSHYYHLFLSILLILQLDYLQYHPSSCEGASFWIRMD